MGTRDKGLIAALVSFVVVLSLLFTFNREIGELFKSASTSVASDESLVFVSATIDDECRQKRGNPIEVSIRNQSKKTIKAVNMSVEIFERGNSRNVARYDMTYADVTFIVRPGDTVRSCWAMNTTQTVRDPVVNATKHYTTFFSPGEKIPD